ncbi:MAG: hypothetical protein OWU33_01800 [Firmicutes bacterium]|nr:hypothetical protein [Bacillota bacterium]
MTRVLANPVLTLINALSQWAWRQVAMNLTWLLRRFVLYPLGWPAVVSQFYRMSQDLAGTVAVALILASLLRLMWPEVTLQGMRWSTRALLERLVTAALLAVVGPWVVQVLLRVNNALVQQLLAPSAISGLTAPQGVLSPLVAGFASLALLVLMLYLAVFYAVRAIEIYLLTASIPWLLLWWATQGDDVILSRVVKEFIVVIFVQSMHAAALWLAFHLLGALAWQGVFWELALLWWMTKLPGELRHLMGAVPGVSALWR